MVFFAIRLSVQPNIEVTRDDFRDYFIGQPHPIDYGLGELFGGADGVVSCRMDECGGVAPIAALGFLRLAVRVVTAAQWCFAFIFGVERLGFFRHSMGVVFKNHRVWFVVVD